MRSERLEILKEVVNAVSDMTINNAVYELNAAAASDSQVEFASDPEKLLTPETELLIKNID